MSRLLTIAAIELKLGRRNRWMLLSTGVLTVFALVLGFVGASPTGTVRVDPLTVAVANLATLSVYLVPLMALLLAFDAIAGEVERGTIQLSFASPVSRTALVAGKFFGHLAVLAVAIAAGYGIAGLVIFVFAGGTTAGMAALASLMVTCIGLGATFLALGYVASAATRHSGTAAALAVGIWLVAVVLYDLALFGALVADADGVFARTVFPWLLVANPADAFRVFNMALLETGTGSPAGGMADTLPFPAWTGLASLAAWSLAALAFSSLLLRRLEP
ncbi:MAG: ABC transporter permease subunit [Rhizobiaceae bacterium]